MVQKQVRNRIDRKNCEKQNQIKPLSQEEYTSWRHKILTDFKENKHGNVLVASHFCGNCIIRNDTQVQICRTCVERLYELVNDAISIVLSSRESCNHFEEKKQPMITYLNEPGKIINRKIIMPKIFEKCLGIGANGIILSELQKVGDVVFKDII